MAVLNIPDENKTLENLEEIKSFLSDRGIEFSVWEASKKLSDEDTQEDILSAYEHELKPFMEKNGFKTADVISVNPNTENIEAIRQKFLKEHTHSEDEVRFFVDGEGLFWFHLNGEVFNLLCTKGDFLSVPAGATHWFDLAPKYTVKAIRIFSNEEGWVANYTNSGIDEKYNKA